MAQETFDVTDVLDLRSAIGQGVTAAIFRAVNDFIFNPGKPWYYYAGAFAGATAAATGIEGASATLYFTANLIEAYVLKSPEGGEIAVFLDGVQQGVIDLEASEEVWELVQLVVDPVGVATRRMDIVNASAAWMALGPILATLDDGLPTVQERTSTMAYNTIAYRLRDAESDTRTQTVAINLPTGGTLAEYQDWSDDFAPLLNAATESAIDEALITLNLTLPAGLRANPLAGAFNERGGLITFDTTGPRADSVRIPAISRTIMPGDAFALTDAAIAAIITALTTTTNGFRPRTVQDYEFETARRGSKSLRK